MMKKALIRIDTNQEQKQNLKNARKNLKDLQPTATDKENLAGRPIPQQGAKFVPHIDDDEPTKGEDKDVQTGQPVVRPEDLVSSEPSSDYWQALAEAQEKRLNESLKENDRLKEIVEALEKENQTCKELLEEPMALAEVLQDMLGKNKNQEDSMDVDGDATEEASGQSI